MQGWSALKAKRPGHKDPAFSQCTGPAQPGRSEKDHPTHLRALRQMRIQGLSAPMSPLVQLICTLRNTRSGWGIMAVKRPSAVVTAVKPPALPLGLNGYCSVAAPWLSTKRMAAMACAELPRYMK